METTERWAKVAGFSYEVSTEGQVRRIETGLVLRPGRTGKYRNYLAVSLCRNGVGRSRRVHVLVLEAFVGPRPTSKHQTNHIDGDTTNNRIENLAWVTPAENMQHAIDTGLLRGLPGSANGRAKLTDDQVALIRNRYAAGGVSQQALADEYGVHQTAIGFVVRGAHWKEY
jgi:hypothetical protein